ncbi:hypothetical protein [Kribbella italica]|uniref:Putative membrane protein YeiB n=1 Tax=Kribbella italica TaxID=1540520 RepID=A0A7W9JFT2_9ACTN|nr:hypothetical protein [Kribbella italica]MBB5841015.1 putative membrane protein YeiB [Kribbella italica]
MFATARPTTQPTTEPARRRSRAVIISAFAVPVMVVGQFAMLAVVPVAVLVAGTFRNARLRALRWWAIALATAYAIPLAAWAIGPDRAPSLSKDMHPALAGVIVAASVAFIAAYFVSRGRAARVPARD